ncbi:proline-rich protein 15-like [Chanos chanos]|uniref:Proline-rich protein 15-like n=1 Tax=Chanos chanos TaxID=29144 RepID=A0A6J2WLH0_CHACN|nr:proline-rich protein 15-like [Chanos chanos]
MAEKHPPWWRSFVGKRRKAARESAAALEQERAHKSQTAAEKRPQLSEQDPTSEQQQTEGGPSDETYDDSEFTSAFSETTNRRNLRVSRSGRFKEKSRARVGLPQNYKEETKTSDKNNDDSR